MNNHRSTIYLILTNKPRSFQITNVTETGVSDCHKFTITLMESYISRLKPKNVHYRSYKNFNVFSNIVNIHAPQKENP